MRRRDESIVGEECAVERLEAVRLVAKRWDWRGWRIVSGEDALMRCSNQKPGIFSAAALPHLRNESCFFGGELGCRHRHDIWNFCRHL